MALTESTMMKLGTELPPFSLAGVDGETVSSTAYAGRPLLVMFICNPCPYVKHIAEELAKLGTDYSDRPIGMVAIQSNDVETYPDDSPDNMKIESQTRGYTFPYLFDETQEVALAFTAACTPDFFLFDADHRLRYRGRLDETRPTRIRSGVYDSTGNEPTGDELRMAIDHVLAGEEVQAKQLPSLGCNIKWKPGNEPSYY